MDQTESNSCIALSAPSGIGRAVVFARSLTKPLLLGALFSFGLGLCAQAQVTAPTIGSFTLKRAIGMIAPTLKPQELRTTQTQVTVGSSGNLGASFVIPEPQATGLLATEPLGMENLGEGAQIIVIPENSSAQEVLNSIINGTTISDGNDPVLEGSAVVRIGSIERLERERIRQAIAYAALHRDPPIAYSIAQIQALDKITAKITTLEIPIGQSREFGTLDILAHSCQKTPPSEPPDYAAHLSITDRTVQAEPYLAFAGWMLRSSPALSAMDHPIYDVWVTQCLGERLELDYNTTLPTQEPAAASANTPAAEPEARQANAVQQEAEESDSAEPYKWSFDQ